MEEMMQCRHCWVPVVPRPEGGRQWGRNNEDEEPKNWIHNGTHNDAGNPVCHRQFLGDDDIEPVDSETE